VRIVDIRNREEAVEILKRIDVDPYGIGAMAPKAVNINILLKEQPCKIANILKQEMLSLGGDAAVARGSVACSVKTTDVLIMGTIKQIITLAGKSANNLSV